MATIFDPRPGSPKAGNYPDLGVAGASPTIDLDLASIQGILDNISNGDETLSRGLTGGLNLGQALYTPGSLGRVAETTSENQAIRNGMRGLIRNRNKELALASRKRQRRIDGFTPEERQVFRDEGVEGINRSIQGALRAARGASLASGVQGGINALPMQNIAREGALARRGLERDIIQANLAERERQLQGLQSVGQARLGENINKATLGLQASQQVTNDELNRRLINLNQFAKERQGQLGLLFGTAGLTTQREGQQQANELANRQLDIADKHGFGGAGFQSFNVSAPSPDYVPNQTGYDFGGLSPQEQQATIDRAVAAGQGHIFGIS